MPITIDELSAACDAAGVTAADLVAIALTGKAIKNANISDQTIVAGLVYSEDSVLTAIATATLEDAKIQAQNDSQTNLQRINGAQTALDTQVANQRARLLEMGRTLQAGQSGQSGQTG